MKMKSRSLASFGMAALGLVFAAGATAQGPTYTTIADVLPAGVNGQPVQGTIVLNWPAFTYNGWSVPQSPAKGYRYAVVNGVVNLALVPTDIAVGIPGATAPVVYAVVITIGGGAPVRATWQVPTLPSSVCPAGTCTVKQVQ